MAYLKEMDRKCDLGACAARATFEVYNNVNSTMGKFCRQHAMVRLREQTETERTRLEKPAQPSFTKGADAR